MKEKQSLESWEQIIAIAKKRGASFSHFLISLFTKPTYFLLAFANMGLFFFSDIKVSEASAWCYTYLTQSILIGISHMVKLWIYTFKPEDANTQGFKSNKGIAIFFFFHFGFFHFIYTRFLPISEVNISYYLQLLPWVLIPTLVNILWESKEESTQNIKASTYMMLPYVRILPIHFAIILGGIFLHSSIGFLVVFILLSTFKTIIEWIIAYFKQLQIPFNELEKQLP